MNSWNYRQGLEVPIEIIDAALLKVRSQQRKHSRRNFNDCQTGIGSSAAVVNRNEGVRRVNVWIVRFNEPIRRREEELSRKGAARHIERGCSVKNDASRLPSCTAASRRR